MQSETEAEINKSVRPISLALNPRNVATNNRLRSWALNASNDEITQFYEFNPTEGTIISKLRNQRTFMVAADTWADMEFGVRETFGSGAYVFLERMGHSYGSSSARKLKPYVRSLSILKKMASAAGFGTFSVRSDEESGTWIRVHALGCVFCHGFGADHDCSFLSGIVQGMAEEFYNKHYMIIRRKCYISSDNLHTCEVVLQEAYYDPKRKRRVAVERAPNPLGEEFR
jgi:predicted hydrocarbon binding protein